MAATNMQKNRAGCHLVVGEAILRGYSAKVGQGSIIDVNGHRAQVQVAAKGAWIVEDVDKYTSATIEFVVFVDVTGGVREFYIAPGNQLRRDVRKRHDAWLAEHGGTRPRTPGSKQATIYPEEVRKWRNDWKRLA